MEHRRNRVPNEMTMMNYCPEESRTTEEEEDELLEDEPEPLSREEAWRIFSASILHNLPRGVDRGAAEQILNEVIVQGDEVHWEDIAGLDNAKAALKENVVYPFLRPDLFLGLREPARGMLLFWTTRHRKDYACSRSGHRGQVNLFRHICE